MRQIIIGIGGGGSGAGKTLFAERLLQRLPGWGAVKCSPSEIYTRVVTEADADSGGKDTGRMIKAGAARAALVEAGRADMEECIGMAMAGMQGLSGVMAEGNSCIRILRPDIIVFVAGSEIKPACEDILKSADIVIAEIADLKIKDKAVLFGASEAEKAADYAAGLAEEMLRA